MTRANPIDRPSRPERPEVPGRLGRLAAQLFRIRTKLLLVHAVLVVTPIFGLTFARSYERELLRSEEEGLIAVGSALATTARLELAAGRTLAGVPVIEAARAAARSLRAQIRILGPDGK